jgi:phage baseplate assembly protein W
VVAIQDLQLTSGDLVLAGRGFGTVTGPAYLRQRIGMALQVPYGSDPFNPLWGSTLPSMIGTPQLAGTSALVSSEVSRVLQQLIDAQQQQMTQATLNGTSSQLDASDVIASVDSVTAAQSSFSPATIQVMLTFTTQAGEQVSISRTLSGS